MSRITASFPLTADFRNQLSAYARHFEEFALLDSCGNTAYGEPAFDYLLAAGAYAVCAPAEPYQACAVWKDFVNAHGDWLFGYLGYELNAGLAAISPPEKKLAHVPALRFFAPIVLIKVAHNRVDISIQPDTICGKPEQIYQNIIETNVEAVISAYTRLNPVISVDTYTENVNRIRQHIIDGDIYELNYCQPFIAEQVDIDPITAYNRLCAVSKAPFSVLYRFGEQYLICGSPERFFRFDGTHMYSQPIKGTRKRGTTAAEDAQLKAELSASSKDRAEHVMIVDLVRNDLTPYAVPGSIAVENMYGIYAFEQVFQMVSTVRATLQPDAHVCDAILQAFPMGSMTGAPKKRAMEIIAETEQLQRGMYSGAFGYFTPDGTCDFNVLIRSMFYHAHTQRLTAWAGGAIVYDSEPALELEECYVKLAGIVRVLQPDT
ncbi:MAG TPA: anthranilate synthase component I family protein [Chitinophagales bacterium]|nr:anthranilate synthase component I family protein [Chitinophagales bacterium]